MLNLTMQRLLLKQQPSFMLGNLFLKTSLTNLPAMHFAQASAYVGPNDHIREEKHQMRKYGMKRHFYDRIPLVQRQVPRD